MPVFKLRELFVGQTLKVFEHCVDDVGAPVPTWRATLLIQFIMNNRRGIFVFRTKFSQDYLRAPKGDYGNNYCHPDNKILTAHQKIPRE